MAGARAAAPRLASWSNAWVRSGFVRRRGGLRRAPPRTSGSARCARGSAGPRAASRTPCPAPPSESPQHRADRVQVLAQWRRERVVRALVLPQRDRLRAVREQPRLGCDAAVLDEQVAVADGGAAADARPLGPAQ